MIKAIFFDADGVLISMVEGHYLSLNKALKEVCGYEINSYEQEKYYNGISTNKKLSILINRGIVNPTQYETIWNKKQEYTFEMIDQLTEDKQKISMMEKLKADGFILACISNSIIKSTYKMLKQIDVLPFLDFYLGNEDFGEKIKPDPYPYLLGIERVNEIIHSFGVSITPKECLIIEDSPKGIMSAERSGCYVLEVANPSQVTYENIINKIEEIK